MYSRKMSDSKYSRKSYKNCREDVRKSKTKRSKHYDERDATYTKQATESKTPPLPSTCSSLDELLKQRDSLRNELNKITEVHPRCDTQRHYLKDGNIFKSPRQFKRNNMDNRDSHQPKKNKKSIEESPNHEDHIESEDEEFIIAKRRMQRKQLLEKFNSLTYSTTNSHNSNEGTSNNEQQSTNSKNQTYTDTHKSSYKLDAQKEVTDMFSEKDFVPNNVPDQVAQDNRNINLSDNWDDTEGYYNIRTGDMIDNNKYTIKSVLGQGVFANVILARDNINKSDVAIKVMRNNELIYKTGLKELALLKEINEADPENKYHCIKLLGHFMHKKHLCVVIEPLYMDLRRIVKQYGKHGLNLKAVVSYSRQLLLALRLLKKIGIIHADIKPDNILVNEQKNILKLCDFGSSSKVGENDVTPYLVSRFYRAPEIILGIPHNNSIDVWSSACTIYEISTGRIMFVGTSNNKMLKCFMDVKGKIPTKLIRRGKFKDQHFNYNNNLLLHKKDEATGREKLIEITNTNPSRDLLQELRNCHKNPSPAIEKKIMQLKDLLDKMLSYDYNQRLSVAEGLKHPFIQEALNK